MDPITLKKTIDDSVEASRAIFTQAMNEKLEENKQEFINAVQAKIGPLETALNTINTNQIQLTEREGLRDRKVTLLEEGLKELQKTVNEKEMGGNDAAFKYNLAAEIHRANKNIIVHGIQAGEGKEVAKDIIVGIGQKHGVECEIKNVFPLGKGANGKQSVMVTLENTFQRNDILKNSQGLPKDIYLDRDIPMLYRGAFKKFKRKQWRLKNFLGYQTQIVFTAHILQLRYRENGKAWTIDEEYVPSPKDSLKAAKGNVTEGGPDPTAVIDKVTLDNAKCSVIITGANKIPQKDLMEMIKEELDPGLYNEIKEWQKRGNNWIVRFPSEALAKSTMKYKDALKKDGNVRIDTFV